MDGSPPPALPVEFTLTDDANARLLEAFRRAYPDKKRVRTFLLSTRIREDEVDLDGGLRDVWIDVLRAATRAALVEDLVRAALADPSSAAYHEQFRARLAVGRPGT